MLRQPKVRTLRFKDDGYIPNHPTLPVLIIGKALRFARSADPAATIEVLLKHNGWRDAWRNGVYDYVHYHSRIHECLTVANGRATLRLGGNRGRELELSKGDVVVLPAGTGHECVRQTKDFLVVGAYPPHGVYDECRGSYGERHKALSTIRKVRVPKNDPLYGEDGPLGKAWKR